MTSPAEAHRESEHREAQRDRLRVLRVQLDLMHQMVRSVGFGREKGETFAEREISKNLNAAYELMQLDIQRRKEDM